MAERTIPQDRPVRRPIHVRVEAVTRLTPQMIRVVLGGDELQGFPAGAFTDHYVKLLFPPPGAEYGMTFDVEHIRATLPRAQWPRTRTYTVREWDPAQARLTIDFVYHGDHGVAGPWAAAARPGDRLQLLGPGGAYRPDPDADWHLLIGDASVVPAISASLPRIPPGVPVHVVIAVNGPEEELPLPTPGTAHLTWVHRRTGSAGNELLQAVRALDLPQGSVHAFLHGEAGDVRAIRRHLLVERGIPRESLSVSGYWKRSRTEEGWREDKPAWNAEVERDAA